MGQYKNIEVRVLIRQLEDMCHDLNFNKENAVILMKKININQVFERNIKYGAEYITTLQAEAINNNNITMLALLLQSGADPNQVYDDIDCEFWNLQYNSCESPEVDEIRLQMAQLLLEYGADPNMQIPDENDNLFEWVWFQLVEDGYCDAYVYMTRFFILLVAYGGKAQIWTPKILTEFDKEKTYKYSFWFLSDESSLHSAVICDENENPVAYL